MQQREHAERKSDVRLLDQFLVFYLHRDPRLGVIVRQKNSAGIHCGMQIRIIPLLQTFQNPRLSALVHQMVVIHPSEESSSRVLSVR